VREQELGSWPVLRFLARSAPPVLMCCRSLICFSSVDLLARDSPSAFIFLRGSQPVLFSLLRVVRARDFQLSAPSCHPAPAFCMCARNAAKVVFLSGVRAGPRPCAILPYWLCTKCLSNYFKALKALSIFFECE
jgi:hypothetical protein